MASDAQVTVTPGNMALSYIARLQVSCSINTYKSTATFFYFFFFKEAIMTFSKEKKKITK